MERGQITLEDCLKAFTEEELLDHDDKVMCEKCKERTSCVKNMAIFRFPPLLVLHIKRFKAIGSHRQKLCTSIQFPVKELDLSDFGTSPVYKG